MFFVGDHSSALTSGGISQTISTHAENNRNSMEETRFPPIKYHLWLGLVFNALTCGILLGTVTYHLIPHVSSSLFRSHLFILLRRFIKYLMKISIIFIFFVVRLFSAVFFSSLSSKNFFDFDLKSMRYSITVLEKYITEQRFSDAIRSTNESHKSSHYSIRSINDSNGSNAWNISRT